MQSTPSWAWVVFWALLLALWRGPHFLVKYQGRRLATPLLSVAIIVAVIGGAVGASLAHRRSVRQVEA
ncbi:integral membrane protein TerC [Corallococcus coralloides]|uniref:Integral membrane protein TerC n=1 Tax=Corallococcus coralloides TaxID=184914 RepID=A0A410RJK6_CORCK|nr:hypothetical protein [Corallococcus coralloides]QAT82122.1 integral membrane protein TerC [Corallococcus coralloides]